MFHHSYKRHREEESDQIQSITRLSPETTVDKRQRQVVQLRAAPTIVQLPTAITTSVLTFLRPRDVCTSRSVCHAWSQNRGAWDTVHVAAHTQISLKLSVCTLTRVHSLGAPHRKTNQDLQTIATSLPNLQQLDLSGINVRGTITQAGFDHLARLTQLRKLNMRRANLNHGSLGFLLLLEHLRELNLSFYRITLNDIIVISKMQQLEVLELTNYDVKFPTTSLLPLKNLTSLRTLNLKDTRILTLSHKHLTSLNLQNSGINDYCLQQVSSISSLRSLNLQGFNTITAAGLQHITSLPHLEHLQLCGRDNCAPFIITKDGALNLMPIGSLKQLDVSYLNAIDEEVLAKFAICPNLTDLNLAWCGSITDEALSHLPPNLLRLNLTVCKITDKGLENMVLTAPNLQRLNLRMCKLLTNAGLAHVARLVDMQHLVLKYCTWLTAAGVAHLTSMARLTVLNLRICDNVDDAAVQLVARIESLHTVDLGYCRKITDVGAISLEQLLKLRVLRLEGCHLLSIDMSKRLHRFINMHNFTV